MPVRKFRSVEDMPPPPWRTPLDGRNLRLAAELSAQAVGLRPRRFLPGVHKFRSVEEMSQARERWESQELPAAP